MNRPVAHKTRRYTLVEILVAMAILVIMMGFLFQFVIGAQRIWSASASTSNVFDQAQIALQLVETDLQSALYANDKEYPGHSIPMGVELNGSELNDRLFMVAPDSSGTGNVGTFLLMYVLDNEELSRYVFDSGTAGYPPHRFYGFDPITDSAQASSFLDLLTVLKNDNDKKNVIVKGVDKVTIQFFPSDSAENPDPANPKAFFFTSVPKAIRITLSVYDATAVGRLLDSGLTDSSEAVKDKKKETARIFTKIVFLR